MHPFLVVVVAAAIAAFTYLYLERAGSRGWPAILCRAVAWTALGLLLLNVSCPVAGTSLRPLVLLDASLSMGGNGGRWGEARDSALRWGEVRPFGDERGGTDSVPTKGRSLLASALLAASASGRPVIIVTDGEIEDAPDLPADLLSRSSVRLFPRPPAADLAVTRVTGPSRVAAGDSIPLDVELESSGDTPHDTVSVQVRVGGRRIALRKVRLANKRGRARIVVPSGEVGPGDHLVEVSLAGWTDAEPRTDTRLLYVSVTPTPGVVLLGAPGDWDSRFLYRTLREVAELPVKGFVRLDAERWRSMNDLRMVPPERVRQAVQGADLLILKGAIGALADGATARGILTWPVPVSEESQLPGDWYLAADGGSPLAGAFLGLPVDSFPPAVQLTPFDAAPGDFVALSARLGRRGVARPAVVTRQEGRTRRVIVGVEGLWRWAFRGGSSESAYRSWVAASASWLLGGADPGGGVARVARPVVESGRPVVFEWTGRGPAAATGVEWAGAGAPHADTLRFDGAGRAIAWLRPGSYRYRLAGGGSGAVAVEKYSEELRPRPRTLAARESRAAAPAGRKSAREWPWLFALCILGLAGEWLARRRLGLR